MKEETTTETTTTQTTVPYTPKPLTLEEIGKLKRSEKRVLIARDVLDQIQVGRLKPTRGTYFYAYNLGAQGLRPRAGQPLHTALADLAPTCKVCALGAVFVARVDTLNQLTVPPWDPTEDYNMRQILSDIFTMEELTAIEHDFEGWDDFDGVSLYRDDDLDPETGRITQKATERRLRYIMRRIIRVHGHGQYKQGDFAKGRKAGQQHTEGD